MDTWTELAEALAAAMPAGLSVTTTGEGISFSDQTGAATFVPVAGAVSADDVGNCLTVSEDVASEATGDRYASDFELDQTSRTLRVWFGVAPNTYAEHQRRSLIPQIAAIPVAP